MVVVFLLLLLLLFVFVCFWLVGLLLLLFWGVFCCLFVLVFSSFFTMTEEISVANFRHAFSSNTQTEKT